MVSFYNILIISKEFPEIVEQIPKDDRSYSRETFCKALKFSHSKRLINHHESDQFNNLIKQVSKIKEDIIDLDDQLGEIPDNYLCGIMGTLLKEPVLLPTSKVIVDMSTAKQMLLDEERDPFNKMALKLH